MSASTFEEPYLQTLLENIAQEEGFHQPVFKISSGSKTGENYVGHVFRVEIKERSELKESKSTSLIFKTSPVSKYRQEKMKTNKLFQTESEVYQIVLPTFNNLLKKFGLSQSDTFPGTVRCLAAQVGRSAGDIGDVIVLEDKSVDGYTMMTQGKSLNLEHFWMFLKRLALWHASAMALYYHEPETANILKGIIRKDDLFCVNANHALLDDFRRSAINNLAFLREPFKKGNSMYEKIAYEVSKLNTEVAEGNIPPDDIPCIIHGDCWFSNVLFKHDKDGTVLDACLIDLQLSRCASPAIDLSYAIYTSTVKKVWKSHFDQFIRYYHEELSSNLKKLDCESQEIFPWLTLQQHMRKYSKHSVLWAIAVLPHMLADSSDISVGVDSDDTDGDIFTGSLKVDDPKRKEMISEGLTDVVVDALSRNFI